jgi:tyrosine-protein kinase Etk/Wzc
MERQNLDQITKNGHQRIDPSRLEVLREMFLGNWKMYLLSLILCVVAAMIFLRYQTPRYKIHASILVRDDTKGSDFGEAIVLQGLGLSSSGKSNVDNEVEVLRSRTLAESVIKDLQLYVEYYTSGNIKTSQLYEEAPVTLHFLTYKLSKSQATTYTVSLKKAGFILGDGARSWQAAFGDTLRLPAGTAILRRTTFPFIPENTYTIRIPDIAQCVKTYRKVLSISATNKQVSMINLVLTDILPEKGEAILKQHIYKYIGNSIDDKNRIADSTISFIDQNLRIVAAELREIESRIEQFRRRNHLTDIGGQSKILLENSSQNVREKNEYEVQLKVIELLQNFLKQHPNRVIPASLVMYEASFTDLINRYNELQMTQTTELMGHTEEHPLLLNIKDKLTELREQIEIGIEAKKSSLQIGISQRDRYSAGFQMQMDLMPAMEATFLDYSRQQQIKQELYIFLLKKRVETTLSKSSTLSNARIIDLPKADDIPYTPNRQLILLVAVLAGIALPSALLYGKGIADPRITTETEIRAVVAAPLLGRIGHNTNPGLDVFSNSVYHVVAEQFRVLRSNLQGLNLHEQKTILLTSSMSGEGKSLITINLAISLAMMDRKVLLMEFDFRKPRIASYLGLKPQGITDALVSGKPIERFIQKSSKPENFHLLVCGQVPPNPAELLATHKISELITSLKTQYDYILFDTPPIGIVTDAQVLSQYADTTLFIIRLRHTFKHQLNEIQELKDKNRLPNLNIVVNDVPVKPGHHYRYKYQTEDTPPSPIVRWLRKITS